MVVRDTETRHAPEAPGRGPSLLLRAVEKDALRVLCAMTRQAAQLQVLQPLATMPAIHLVMDVPLPVRACDGATATFAAASGACPDCFSDPAVHCAFRYRYCYRYIHPEKRRK